MYTTIIKRLLKFYKTWNVSHFCICHTDHTGQPSFQRHTSGSNGGRRFWTSASVFSGGKITFYSWRSKSSKKTNPFPLFSASKVKRLGHARLLHIALAQALIIKMSLYERQKPVKPVLFGKKQGRSFRLLSRSSVSACVVGQRELHRIPVYEKVMDDVAFFTWQMISRMIFDKTTFDSVNVVNRIHWQILY